MPQKECKDILSSNVLPIDKNIYYNDDFELFLERRASEVLSKIDRLTS